MPFKSQAQRRLFHAKASRGEIASGTVKEWEDHTPKGKKLPEKVTPQEKAAKFNAFQSIGGGLLSLGSKFGGDRWVNRLNRIRARAEAGDTSAERILSVLGMSSMMLGAGVGTALGNKANMPVLGGAVGAALGAAPSLVSKEKKTNVLMPGFASETRAEEEMEPTMNPEKAAMAKLANGDEGAESAEEEMAETMDPDKATSLINFIAEHGNKGIDDDDFHAHSELIGVDPHEAEEEVYRTLASLLGGKNDVIQGGKAQGLPNSMFPKEELEAGAKIEKEHTPSTAIATEIAKDHDVESDEYYTGEGRLEDMEEDMDKQKALGNEEGAAPDQQKMAFKYGFFLKVAELGLTPSEFTKAAFTGPLIAAGAAGKAAGKAGETASGAGRWGLEKALGALKFGAKTPLILAPIAGMLLGGAYRGLTSPSYEEPEDLRRAERVGLYRRLAREALRKARKKQDKRLGMSGAKEKLLTVPELGR